MSTAFERAPWMAAYEPPASFKDESDDDVASCSSSIGRNSVGVDDGDESEVQSSYKGPLDTMHTLEDSLPTRCGQAISSFHCGKSKSLASLPDALPLVPTTVDACKIGNACCRKRKNLHSFDLWEENPNSRRSNGDVAASKRLTKSNRTTAAMPDAGHSSSSSSGSNSFGPSTGEERQSQSHCPYAKSVLLRKMRISLLTKPCSSADLEDVASSTPSPAESGFKQREVF